MTTVMQAEKVKNRHLIFRISNDLYGIEVHYLKEVFQTRNILKLPRTSSVLEGIVNLRGYIVSIFNLSVLLWGKDSREKDEISSNTNSNVILLVTIKDQDIGILVDQIHQLDTITEFKSANNSYFQGKELLNPSLVSKIGLLKNGQTIFILDLEGLLGDFVTSKTSGRKMTSDEDFDFDFDQYTLPDPDEASEKSSSDKSANFDMDQLNLPDNLQTDEFDQRLLNKVDADTKGGDENLSKDNSETKKVKKTKKLTKKKDEAKIEKDSREGDKSKGKEETKGTEKAKVTKKSKKGNKSEENE
ncbi:MAG: chemotaxis protein CheW [Candidatus Heimdallarchaeota archaeon]|nr:MAG: chemotaxis protein CheW [Candidatus Heimdallarchaeota archaeon]